MDFVDYDWDDVAAACKGKYFVLNFHFLQK
jgi:hypothetical protein